MENSNPQVTVKMAAIKENKEMSVEVISAHLSVIENSQKKLHTFSEQADAISRKLEEQ